MRDATKNALTFVAGFCDTATFIHMGGIFSAHVTGNFVLFAAALAQGIEPHDYLKILTFPVFILAVIIGTILFGKNVQTGPRKLLWAMTGLLVLSAAASFLQNSWIDAAVTMTVVLALGIQNAMHHFIPGPMTTVMTGTVMNATATFTEKFILRRTQTVEGKPFVSPLPGLWMIIAFLVGCVLAAVLTINFGLMSLTVPAITMLLVMILERKVA